VRLRECLISFIIETANDNLVSVGEVPPQRVNFREWSELLANAMASGESNKHLRSYLKKLSVETWEYVNWLTHAKNAIRPDADIGLKAVLRSRRRRRAAPLARLPPGSAFGTPARRGRAASTLWLARSSSSPAQSA
jgi:hypothetical protein